jgi:hypothetical protein
MYFDDGIAAMARSFRLALERVTLRLGGAENLSFDLNQRLPRTSNPRSSLPGGHSASAGEP